MTNQNQPREYDAVLGGKSSLPVNAAVLGGIEGVERRLTAADELVRVGAVRDAMKYGERGLDVAIASIDDESWQVRREAMYLLQEKLTHPKVKPLLANGKLIRIYREEFETCSVNARGEIIKRERRQAEVFAEDLGGGVQLEMVSIPGGSFMMGSPNTEEKYQGYDGSEEPQHRVNVGPFFLGKYPVTQQEYEVVMGKNPSCFKGTNRPVERVSWREAKEFCRRLSQKTRRQYRLPSEAEWEYATRAGTTTPFYFGPTITTDLANYNGNYSYGSASKGVDRKQTTEVGSFPPNDFGLYDLYGNVFEWCEDLWHVDYNEAPTDGTVWESGGNSSSWVGCWEPGGSNSSWMLRGGSWRQHPTLCRSAFRVRGDATIKNCDVGFRVVLVSGL